jgi:hypothetical protein
VSDRYIPFKEHFVHVVDPLVYCCLVACFLSQHLVSGYYERSNVGRGTSGRGRCGHPALRFKLSNSEFKFDPWVLEKRDNPRHCKREHVANNAAADGSETYPKVSKVR